MCVNDTVLTLHEQAVAGGESEKTCLCPRNARLLFLIQLRRSNSLGWSGIHALPWTNNFGQMFVVSAQASSMSLLSQRFSSLRQRSSYGGPSEWTGIEIFSLQSWTSTARATQSACTRELNMLHLRAIVLLVAVRYQSSTRKNVFLKSGRMDQSGGSHETSISCFDRAVGGSNVSHRIIWDECVCGRLAAKACL